MQRNPRLNWRGKEALIETLLHPSSRKRSVANSSIGNKSQDTEKYFGSLTFDPRGFRNFLGFFLEEFKQEISKRREREREFQHGSLLNMGIQFRCSVAIGYWKTEFRFQMCQWIKRWKTVFPFFKIRERHFICCYIKKMFSMKFRFSCFIHLTFMGVQLSLIFNVNYYFMLQVKLKQHQTTLRNFLTIRKPKIRVEYINKHQTPFYNR